jgi:hypothetical protein
MSEGHDALPPVMRALFALIIGTLCGHPAEAAFRRHACQRAAIVERAVERMDLRFGRQAADLWRGLAVALLEALDDQPITDELPSDAGRLRGRLDRD